MSEFGAPQRSATQDANEGRVNAPATRYNSSKQMATQQVSADTNPGLDAFTSNLGNALAARMHEDTTNIAAKRSTAAAIRQGTNHAINETDTAVKRTGWTKAIFGENVDYRAAQQRAVQNTVQSEYIKQAAEIDQYAGETPDEYQKRLMTGLDTALEPYEGDGETQALVTAAYNQSATKLAAKHYQSHYAYNQQQQQQTVYNGMLQSADQWNIEAGLVSSADEVAGLKQSQAMLFNGSQRPNGMSEMAYRNTVNDALGTTLRSGNINMWKAAKENGWDKDMTQTERRAMDQSISAYDTDFGQGLSLVVEDAELAAREAANRGVAMQVYTTAKSELDKAEARLSGTERGDLALAQARNKLGRLAEQAYKAAMTNEGKADHTEEVKLALRETDPAIRAGKLSQVKALGVNSTEMKEALDVTIVEDVERLTGEEDIDISTANNLIAQNVGVARKVAARLRGMQVESPMVKRLAETVINGYQGYANEDGVLSEEGKTSIAAVSQFMNDTDSAMTLLGKENYIRLAIIRRNLASNNTVEQTMQDLDAYRANKGKRDTFNIQWNLGKDETKRDRVASLYKKYTGEYPKTQALAYAMGEMDTGLTIGYGDMGEAEQYLRASLMHASTNYRGRTIVNGGQLNKVTDYNFEQLLDGAQMKSGDVSLLTPVLYSMGMVGNDAGEPIAMKDNMNIYVEDGISGFFISSPEAQQPVHVSEAQMRMWSDTMNQRKRMQELRKEAEQQSFTTWFSDMQEMVESGVTGLQ